MKILISGKSVESAGCWKEPVDGEIRLKPSEEKLIQQNSIEYLEYTGGALKKKTPADIELLKAAKQKKTELKASDDSFIRVGEDLIDVLISKGIIELSDFPEESREKINNRKSLRQI